MNYSRRKWEDFMLVEHIKCIDNRTTHFRKIRHTLHKLIGYIFMYPVGRVKIAGLYAYWGLLKLTQLVRSTPVIFQKDPTPDKGTTAEYLLKQAR